MKFWKYIFSLLLLMLAGITIAVFHLPAGNIQIIACNVGLGNVVLVTYEATQILTDGGTDKNVLTCLENTYRFWIGT
jgi:hypothetical protein